MNDPALPPGFEEDPPLPPGFEVDSPTPGPEAAGPFRQIGRTTKGEPISIPGQDIAAAVTQQPVAAQKGGPMMARVLGLVETGLTMATGIVGGTLGAAGGLAGGMAGSLATGQGGTMQDLEADMAEGARKLTYTPRTPLGRQYAGAVAEAIEPVAQQMGPLAGLSGELTAIGRVAGRGVQKAGDTVAARTTTPAAEAAKTAKQVALEAPQREGIQAARDAGYVLTPQQAKGGKVSRTVAGLSGEPRLEKLASQKNAEVTNRLIREDLQIPEDQPLTREALASRRKAAHEPYDRIKKVGQIQNDEQYMRDLDALSKPYIDAAKDFPELLSNPIVKRVEGLRKPQVNAASAVEVVKDLRNEADKAFRAGDKALGKAYRSAADAVDNSMDRYLNKLTKRVKGAPELAKAVEDYRAARKTIAKTYVADKALNDTTGNVDAAVYARELKKGTKLDGGALTVARAAQQFPQSLQRAEKTGGTGPTYADVLAATVSKEALALGARPAARSVLLSETVQERMAPKSKPKAPTPEPELTAEQGPLPARGEQPPDPRLAAADRDWETVPGAADPRRLEVVPEEGLVPAVDEAPGPQRVLPGGADLRARSNEAPIGPMPPGVVAEPPTPRRAAGEQIPAVPGRPDLPDTMVAGPPKEVGATDATGKAMQDALATIDEFEGKAGGPIPAGEATEVMPTDPRLADIEALKAEATSPAVKKALEAEATKVKKDIKTEQETMQRKADADELRTLAGKTKDAALKQRLLDRAQKLEADEKIPVGEVVEGQPEIKPEKGERSAKPIPAGEATEVPNEPATGRAPEIEKLPTGDAKVITESGVEPAIPVGEAKELFVPPEKAGTLEVAVKRNAKGKLVGTDVKGDPYEVNVTKREDGTVLVEAFDPVSNQRRAFMELTAGDGGMVEADAKVAPYLKKRNLEEVLRRAAKEEGYESKPKQGEPDVPDQQASQKTNAQAGENQTAEAGGKAAEAATLPEGLTLHELKSGEGFEVRNKQGNRVAYLYDNLKKGQAEQLGENANVAMVKVDKAYERKGIGRALYQAFEQKHGGRIMPSGKTEPGAWKQWKKHYPEKVDAFVQQEIDRVKGGADAALVVRNITDPEVRARVAAGVKPGDRKK